MAATTRADGGAARERVVVVVHHGDGQVPAQQPQPPPTEAVVDNRGATYASIAILIAIGIGVGCFGNFRAESEHNQYVSYATSMSVWRYHVKVCFFGACAEHSATDVDEMEPCGARRNLLLAGRIVGVVALIAAICMISLGGYHRASSGGNALTNRAPLNGLVCFVGVLIVVCCYITFDLFYGRCPDDGNNSDGGGGGGGSSPSGPSSSGGGGVPTHAEGGFGASPFGYGAAIVAIFACVYANNRAAPPPATEDGTLQAGAPPPATAPEIAEGVVVNDNGATAAEMQPRAEHDDGARDEEGPSAAGAPPPKP